MRRQIAVFTIVLCAVSTSSYAQQCLHGQGETVEQATRRREALTATRLVNTIQLHQFAKLRTYLRHTELAPFASTRGTDFLKRLSLNPDEDVVPGWTLTLNLTENGYWLMIRDKTDPCGFAFIANQEGVIFTAEPIR